jgi:hypothetical protein
MNGGKLSMRAIRRNRSTYQSHFLKHLQNNSISTVMATVIKAIATGVANEG